MKKWSGLFVALLAVACNAREQGEARHSDASADSASNEGPLPSKPVRIDTMRTATGEFFSPSYTWYSVNRAGRVVAIDQDDKRVVLFDSTGRQLASAGRNGAGPGEFRCPTAPYVLTADSIAIWDACLRRISVFTPTLKFVRSELFPRWNFRADSRPVGRLADGRWVGVLRSANGARPEVGIREATDSAQIVVGLSQQIPVEFVRLRNRSGLNVVSKMDRNNFSVTNARFEDFNAGYGVVCETGVILADTGGVREINARGEQISKNPLPRAGKPLTDADRKDVVDRTMMFRLDSMPEASSIRTRLMEMASKFNRSMLKPLIDVDGQFWYRRTSSPKSREIIVDRVDVTGKTVESMDVRYFGDMQIGRRTVGMIDYGSDTVGLTVVLAHLPPSNVQMRSTPLGRCSTSFTY